MNNEFARFGTVIYCRMFRPNQSKLGAEPGCVFIEFANAEAADNAKLRMSGKKYDGKEIKIISVSDRVFQEEFRV